MKKLLVLALVLAPALGMAQVPNANQLALLRWYPANQAANTFTLQDGPASVAFDGANIWVVNSGSVSVSKLKANDGTIVGTYVVGSVGVLSSVAFDGANVWVTGYYGVAKLRASDGAVLASRSLEQVQGIAFDGTYIWVTQQGMNLLTKIRPSDGSVLASYTVGTAPVSLAYDGANLWVANAGTDSNGDSVTKVRASDGFILNTIALRDGGPGGPPVRPTAVAFDGANVWVAGLYSNEVIKLAASNDTILGRFSVAPLGSWPSAIVWDGTYIWTANAASNNVTKLTASGSLVGTFASGAPAGSRPSGIAFDGANVWVANYNVYPNPAGTVSKL